jgi:hypothetical protein
MIQAGRPQRPVERVPGEAGIEKRLVQLGLVKDKKDVLADDDVLARVATMKVGQGPRVTVPPAPGTPIDSPTRPG